MALSNSRRTQYVGLFGTMMISGIFMLNFIGFSWTTLFVFWSGTLIDTISRMVLFFGAVAALPITLKFLKEKKGNEKEKTDWTRVRNLSIPLIALTVILQILDFRTVTDHMAVQIDTMYRYIGIVLVIIGLEIRTVAQVHLGENWSEKIKTHKGHNLVKTGPYRYIRHPIYSSYIALTAGLFLMTANWLLGSLFLFYTLISLIRIPYEESFLKTVFADYDNYRRNTGTIFPKMFQ